MNFFKPANVINAGWTDDGSTYVKLNVASRKVLMGLGSTDDSSVKVGSSGDIVVLSGITSAKYIGIGLNSVSNSYLKSNLPIAFMLSGSEKMRLDATGRLGINVIPTIYQLHEKHTADGWGIVSERGGGAKAGIYCGIGGEGTSVRIGSINNYYVDLVVSDVSYIRMISNTITINKPVTCQAITALGALSALGGITVTDGSILLDNDTDMELSCSLNATANLKMGINSATLDSYLGMISDNNLNIITNNLKRMTVFANGHVQINDTTDRGYQFANAGSAYFNGAVTITGNLIGDSRINAATLRIGASGAPDSCAIVDFVTTTQGVKLPKVTTAQKNAISGTVDQLKALMVFDTTENKLSYHNGSTWILV